MVTNFSLARSPYISSSRLRFRYNSSYLGVAALFTDTVIKWYYVSIPSLGNGVVVTAVMPLSDETHRFRCKMPCNRDKGTLVISKVIKGAAWEKSNWKGSNWERQQRMNLRCCFPWIRYRAKRATAKAIPNFPGGRVRKHHNLHNNTTSKNQVSEPSTPSSVILSHGDEYDHTSILLVTNQ